MSEWISVKDRLPDESQWGEDSEFITYCENNHHHDPIVTVLRYERSGWLDDNDRCWDLFVTHWMPLPEPPVTN